MHKFYVKNQTVVQFIETLCKGDIDVTDVKQHNTVRARGLEGLHPLDSGKAIIFREKAKFSGYKPAAKNEKKLHLLNEKKNGIHSVTAR